MTYPDTYEYPDEVMTAMANGLQNFFGANYKSLEFYKNSDPINFKKKIDGTVYLLLTSDYDLHLQIKRSDHYPGTFSIGGNTIRSYLEEDYDIEALLVGTAHDRNMHLFYWSDFIEFITEIYHTWKSPYGDYYVIPLIDLKSLYSQKVPYLEEDYKILQNYWDDK